MENIIKFTFYDVSILNFFWNVLISDDIYIYNKKHVTNTQTQICKEDKHLTNIR